MIGHCRPIRVEAAWSVTQRSSVIVLVGELIAAKSDFEYSSMSYLGVRACAIFWQY
jgi:hypothetical protein